MYPCYLKTKGQMSQWKSVCISDSTGLYFKKVTRAIQSGTCWYKPHTPTWSHFKEEQPPGKWQPPVGLHFLERQPPTALKTSNAHHPRENKVSAAKDSHILFAVIAHADCVNFYKCNKALKCYNAFSTNVRTILVVVKLKLKVCVGGGGGETGYY